MKKGILLLLTLCMVYAMEAQVVFQEDFETLTIDGEVALEGWINYAETGTVKWIGKTYNNDVYAQTTSYQSGEANKIWLITPAVNLDGSDNERLEFNVKIGYWTHAALSVFYSTNFDGTTAGIATATWNEITADFNIPEVPTNAYGDFVAAGVSDFSEITGTVYVAFVYTGDANNSKTTTIQVDDVTISAPGTDIVSFDLNEEVEGATIDKDAGLVKITVLPGTDVTNLTPSITLSAGATSTPASGVVQDFSDTVTYTVNSELGSLSRNWKVVVKVMSSEPTSIYNIQYVEDPSDNDASAFKNSSVLTAGIVTAKNLGGSKATYYIQSDSGMWNGLYVYDGNDIGTVLSLGDSVHFVGKITEYYGLTQITPVQITKIAGRKKQPAPLWVTDTLTEGMEGCLVTLKNVTVAVDNSDDSKAAWIATTEAGKKIKIFDELFEAFTPETDTIYNITGPVTYAFSNFRICPRDINDIEKVKITSTVDKTSEKITVYPNPTINTLYFNGITDKNIVVINAVGKIVMETRLSNNLLHVEKLPKGVYFIKTGTNVVRFIKK